MARGRTWSAAPRSPWRRCRRSCWMSAMGNWIPPSWRIHVPLCRWRLASGGHRRGGRCRGVLRRRLECTGARRCRTASARSSSPGSGSFLLAGGAGQVLERQRGVFVLLVRERRSLRPGGCSRSSAGFCRICRIVLVASKPQRRASVLRSREVTACTGVRLALGGSFESWLRARRLLNQAVRLFRNSFCERRRLEQNEFQLSVRWVLLHPLSWRSWT